MEGHTMLKEGLGVQMSHRSIFEEEVRFHKEKDRVDIYR